MTDTTDPGAMTRLTQDESASFVSMPQLRTLLGGLEIIDSLPLVVIDGARGSVRIHGEDVQLTELECTLLCALARRSPAVVPVSELALELGRAERGDTRWLVVLASRLRAKLREHGVALIAVRRRGYAVEVRSLLVDPGLTGAGSAGRARSR